MKIYWSKTDSGVVVVCSVVVVVTGEEGTTCHAD